MSYDFVEYAKNLNLYAILDAVVLAAAVTLLVLLFVYRRNVRVLIMLLAIILCGNLMGVPGILLGIPLFSVIYTLLKESTARRLKARHITSRQAISNTPPGVSDEDDPDGDEGVLYGEEENIPNADGKDAKKEP